MAYAEIKGLQSLDALIRSRFWSNMEQ